MSSDAGDQESAKAIFREMISLLDGGGFVYAVGGSLATYHWTGSSGEIGDVDIMVREDEARAILKVLEGAGYATQEMAHSWLHKAFKDSVTVDLMYRLKNEATLDDDFADHRVRADLLGTLAYVMSAEDQIAALAVTVDRQTISDHWYSVLDLMADNDLDWDYLASRLEIAPLRALSVLYFALDEQIPVEKSALDRMTSLL